VPRLYPGDHAYLLQNDDRRIVFVIPFEREFSLIGTTELAFSGDPAMAQVTEAEVAYLCDAVARWFVTPPRAAVVWRYAGVRPLYEDRARSASAVTRDYVFDLDTAGVPALSIFGGKLTTHRRLAEHALARLAPHLRAAGPPWTAASQLPGGTGDSAALTADLRRDYPFLSAETAERLAQSYGSDARRIFGGARRMGDLGRDFGHGLSEAELAWLVEREWAITAEDVLWRRSKLGLVMTPSEAQEIAAYLARVTRGSGSPAAAASAPAGRTAYRSGSRTARPAPRPG
jgi:glycerol-3-phosphate dehydrogenase